MPIHLLQEVEIFFFSVFFWQTIKNSISILLLGGTDDSNKKHIKTHPFPLYGNKIEQEMLLLFFRKESFPLSFLVNETAVNSLLNSTSLRVRALPSF